MQQCAQYRTAHCCSTHPGSQASHAGAAPLSRQRRSPKQAEQQRAPAEQAGSRARSASHMIGAVARRLAVVCAARAAKPLRHRLRACQRVIMGCWPGMRRPTSPGNSASWRLPTLVAMHFMPTVSEAFPLAQTQRQRSPSFIRGVGGRAPRAACLEAAWTAAAAGRARRCASAPAAARCWCRHSPLSPQGWGPAHVTLPSPHTNELSVCSPSPVNDNARLRRSMRVLCCSACSNQHPFQSPSWFPARYAEILAHRNTWRVSSSCRM